MSERNDSPQYATRRERRAAERAAEAAAAGTPSDDAAPTGAGPVSGPAFAAGSADVPDADDDGVAWGAGVALTREEYEARMAELAELSGHAGERAVEHHTASLPVVPAAGHLDTAENSPGYIDPQIRAEQEALAARAAALNASLQASSGAPAGFTDAPLAAGDTSALSPAPEPDQAHNLGAVTPLQLDDDPSAEFRGFKAPATSQIFLDWDHATNRVRPLGMGFEPVPPEAATEADAAEVDAPSGPAPGWVPSEDLFDESTNTTGSADPRPVGALPGADAAVDSGTATGDADAVAAGPSAADVVSADSVSADSVSASDDAETAAETDADPDDVRRVSATDAAGLDPLDARTARTGRRSWLAALMTVGVVAVAALVVLGLLFFPR